MPHPVPRRQGKPFATSAAGPPAEPPPAALVWAFGSRAKWTARPGSDLAVDASRPLTRREATRLAVEYEVSNLPHKVDVVDWQSISESFRKAIGQDRVPLPNPLPAHTSIAPNAPV